ncbi:MAG TPA: hypothetical protein PK147_06375, partial [Saprospiraceae bacterium]|nr:hypothetical protein [Saprospiraceae bacterium]
MKTTFRIGVSSKSLAFGFMFNNDLGILPMIPGIWQNPKYLEIVILDLENLLCREDTELDKITDPKANLSQFLNDDFFGFSWGMSECYIASYKYFSIIQVWNEYSFMETKVIYKALKEYRNFLCIWKSRIKLSEELEEPYYAIKKIYNKEKLNYLISEKNGIYFTFHLSDQELTSTYTYEQFINSINWNSLKP